MIANRRKADTGFGLQACSERLSVLFIETDQETEIRLWQTGREFLSERTFRMS